MEDLTNKEQMENSVIESSIISMTRGQLASIKNYEKDATNSNEYDQGFHPVNTRDYPKHFNPRMAFRFPVNMEGFEKWYKNRVRAVHILTDERLDKIGESNFN